MKRSGKIILSIVVIAAVCAIGAALWISAKSYIRVIRSNWSMCELVYQNQTDGSELFLFYREETGTVYAVESFI